MPAFDAAMGEGGLDQELAPPPPEERGDPQAWDDWIRRNAPPAGGFPWDDTSRREQEQALARSQALAARAAQLRVGDAEPTPDGTNNFVDADNYVSETWWKVWNAKPPDCELQALAWATTTGTVTENWSDSTAPKVWHTSHDDWTLTSLKWDRKDNVVEEVWHRRVQQRTSNDSNTMPQ